MTLFAMRNVTPNADDGETFAGEFIDMTPSAIVLLRDVGEGTTETPTILSKAGPKIKSPIIITKRNPPVIALLAPFLFAILNHCIPDC